MAEHDQQPDVPDPHAEQSALHRFFDDQRRGRARRHYPMGRIGPDDDGALACKLSLDRVHRRVVIDFALATEQLALDINTAVQFAGALIEKAAELAAAAGGTAGAMTLKFSPQPASKTVNVAIGISTAPAAVLDVTSADLDLQSCVQIGTRLLRFARKHVTVPIVLDLSPDRPETPYHGDVPNQAHPPGGRSEAADGG